MNKKELITKLSAKMQIPQVQTSEFIKNFQDVLTEALKEDEPIMLQGFGTLSAWNQSERKGRNPRSGVPCVITARTSVKFKPGKFLLKALNP